MHAYEEAYFLVAFRVIEVAIKSGKEEVGEKVLWHGGGLGLLEAWAKELGNNLYKTEEVAYGYV